MSEAVVTSEHVEALRTWLGDDGAEHLRRLRDKYGDGFCHAVIVGEDLLVIYPERTARVMMDMGIPHPVHFREGMSIRNFLRRSGLCTGWTHGDLEALWDQVTKEAIS